MYYIEIMACDNSGMIDEILNERNIEIEYTIVYYECGQEQDEAGFCIIRVDNELQPDMFNDDDIDIDDELAQHLNIENTQLKNAPLVIIWR